jgi:hypothetical protein
MQRHLVKSLVRQLGLGPEEQQQQQQQQQQPPEQEQQPPAEEQPSTQARQSADLDKWLSKKYHGRF